MREIRIIMNNKTEKLIKAIINTECLEVTYKTFESALGDDVIECKGCKEDIETLLDVYNMVNV